MMCHRALDGYVCTRDRGHSEDHAAHMDRGGSIAATWADGDTRVRLHPLRTDGLTVHTGSP